MWHWRVRIIVIIIIIILLFVHVWHRPPHGGGAFPFSPKGWIFFISLHTGGYHPSGCRYLRTPAGLSTISIFPSPPSPTVKSYYVELLDVFMTVMSYSLRLSPPARTQTTYFTDDSSMDRLRGKVGSKTL